MSRDTGRDDPFLRLERSVQQLLAWMEVRETSALEDAVRACAHLLRYAQGDDGHEADLARLLLQRALARGVPSNLAQQAALGEACLQANEVLGDRCFLDAAHSVCEALLQGPRDECASGVCLSAVPGRQLAVHHANLQAAALLARVGVRAGRDDFVALARRAAGYTCARQLPDGSWPHGEAPHLRWVDHFHAGSMVGSLAALCGTGLVAVAPVALERAVRRLLATHFDGDGQPRVAARPGGPLEADVLVAADAMDALGRFAALQPAVLPFVAGLAQWVSRHVQPWSLWREPPSPHGPARIVRALARAQSLLLEPRQLDGLSPAQGDGGVGLSPVFAVSAMTAPPGALAPGAGSAAGALRA